MRLAICKPHFFFYAPTHDVVPRAEKTLFCTPAGARTLDTLIKSQVLYQLSYGCIAFWLKRVQRY